MKTCVCHARAPMYLCCTGRWWLRWVGRCRDLANVEICSRLQNFERPMNPSVRFSCMICMICMTFRFIEIIRHSLRPMTSHSVSPRQGWTSSGYIQRCSHDMSLGAWCLLTAPGAWEAGSQTRCSWKAMQNRTSLVAARRWIANQLQHSWTFWMILAHSRNKCGCQGHLHSSSRIDRLRVSSRRILCHVNRTDSAGNRWQ